MREFWGNGWTARTRFDPAVDSARALAGELGAIKLLLTAGQDNPVVEMKKEPLQGKLLLEVGCGQGSCSALFAQDGARVVSVDLTAPAVRHTSRKLALLGLDGRAVQADAEFLPFRDNSFDVVFSSGVLHHTPDTEKAIAHIHRVLKPGGRAVVMLYAKGSFHYAIDLLLIRGILLGGLFRHGRRWLGPDTELAWNTKPDLVNPITRVYSKRGMRRLFRDFTVVSLRKNGFYWSHLFPGIYRLIPRRRVTIGGNPELIPTTFEAFIGRFAGFALTIDVRKPA